MSNSKSYNNNPTKDRNSNLELFRIVVMLLIVAHHYLVNSGLKEIVDSQPATIQSYYLYFIGMWGKTGINCFVLITGYFMCKSKITLKKFFKLLLEVYFYKILIGFLFIFAGYESITVKNVLYLFLPPVRYLNNNFVSAFLIYYLFIPFLNIIVNNLSKRNHQCLILLCVIVYCLLAKAGQITLNYVAWFAVLHIIASYLRFYSIPCIKSCKTWGIVSIVLIVLSVASVFIIKTFINGHFVFWFVSDSNAPFALLTGIAAFMFFKNLRVKQSKFINSVAATTFGVLLIHANSDAMRQWLWKDTLQNLRFFGTPMGWLHPIISVLAVFAICSMIDFIRIKYIEKPLLPKIVKSIESFIQSTKEKL